MPSNSNPINANLAMLNAKEKLCETIRQAWGWIGLDPVAILATNPFGNYIVRDAQGRFWRICPEELSIEVIAADAAQYDALWASENFQRDWRMTELVSRAQALLGPVNEDRCYCLKFPGVLGGPYDDANLGTVARQELLSFAGDLAHQIKDAPDGAQIQLEFRK